MGFGGFDPLNVDQHQHSPQKAGSHAETHHITYIGPSVWVHQKSKIKVITGSNALSKLLKGRFWGFSSTGATHCTDGGEIWHGGGDRSPLLNPKFHPIGATIRVSDPKLNLLRFDQNVEYKRPSGAYPLRNFHKKFAVCTPFQDALAVTVSLDLLTGLWSYGDFKLTEYGYNQIFSTPRTAKLCVRPRKLFEVQKRAPGPLLPCQVWWGSDFTCRQGGQKRWVFCLFVCLFTTLLNVRDCMPDFAMKALECINYFDAVR